MSAPTRRTVVRYANCALTGKSVRSITLPFRQAITCQQQRHASGDGKVPNPVLDEYLAQQKERPIETTPERWTSEEQREDVIAKAKPKQGDIDAGSIFEDEARQESQERREQDGKVKDDQQEAPVDPSIQAAALDPMPLQTKRFLRKKLVAEVKHRGRVSRELFLKRTEREHTLRSHNMKTSTKKLGMLARQIAGKRIDEAIAQMRFSGKRVAQEVLKQLEAARDEAVVMRGMGLGAVTPQTDSASSVEGAVESAVASGATAFKPVDIQLKSGSRLTVTDPSQIYIDQAWVGRGPYGKLMDPRARGRMFILRTPWTSLSIVLKEEVTRVRQHEERVAKQKKKRTGEKVWQALPDRPISNHRAWYSW